MIVRLLHKIWNIFWKTVITLSALVIIFGGIGLLALQTPTMKDYIGGRMAGAFNDTFRADLSFDRFEGTMPYYYRLYGVELTLDDQLLAEVESLELQFSLWDLLFHRLTVQDLNVKGPEMVLRSEKGGLALLREAFSPHEGSGSAGLRVPDRPGGGPEGQQGRDLGLLSIHSIEILAPEIRIQDGRLYADFQPADHEHLNLPESVDLRQIETTFFLESSPSQRFLDVNRFQATLYHDGQSNPLEFRGQVYDDRELLEFNALQVELGQSTTRLDGELRPVNLLEGDIASQLRRAEYRLSMGHSSFYLPELGVLLPDLAEWGERTVHAQFDADGSRESLRFENLALLSGESQLHAGGLLEGLTGDTPLRYELDLHELQVHEPEVTLLRPDWADMVFRDWGNVTARGLVTGNRDSLDADLSFDLPAGQAGVTGHMGLRPGSAYDLRISADSLDLAAFPSLDLPGSEIYFTSRMRGEGIMDREQPVYVDLSASHSHVGDLQLPGVTIYAEWRDRLLEAQVEYNQAGGHMESDVVVDLSGPEPSYSVEGESSDLDLQRMYDWPRLPQTAMNTVFDFVVQGPRIDELHGRANMDIHESRVNGDTLTAHQMYLDLDPPVQGQARDMRFTSTFLDLYLSGDVEPLPLRDLGMHWFGYLMDRVNEELLLREPDQHAWTWRLEERQQDAGFPHQLRMEAELKDYDLLHAYIPELPVELTDTRLDLDISAGSDQVQVSGSWADSHARIGGYEMDGGSAALTANLQYGEKLRDFSMVDTHVELDRFSAGPGLELQDLESELTLRNDSLHAVNRVEHPGNDAFFTSRISGSLQEEFISARIHDMQLGRRGYVWENEEEAVLTFDHRERLELENFRFLNQEQSISVSGAYSPHPEDSVTYRLNDIRLQEISGLIDGRADFSGVLNANFTSSYLTRDPDVEGRLWVDELRMDERILGDVELQSRYSVNEQRFNTSLTIRTGEEQYGDYLAGNDGIGQDVELQGWFERPDQISGDEPLYYFDASFNEIDLWVLPYIVDDVFESVEGRGDGGGYLSGDFSGMDFGADLNVHSAQVEPVFFGTRYEVDGPVRLDRQEGVLLDELQVTDGHGGHATLDGRVGFNDFDSDKDLDITFVMDNLRFLENTYDPDIPFYGTVSGSGVVNVGGTTIAPFVSTPEEITITSDSHLSIPLMGDIRVQDHGRFIQYVSSFDEIHQLDTRITDVSRLSEMDREFMEVFEMDLEFVAPENSMIELVFDRVTDEHLQASGNGRVRVVLEDEELQMYGRYEISGGEYQFVGGDIFTRRFTLQEGGSIAWDGDPANATVDISAAYRARPNINALLAETTTDQRPQRVPVDLMLDITGPLNAIENDFHFQFPNAVDATQNATVLNLLNSEEQKLLQATSLLLTGGFFPISSVGAGQAREFGTSLQTGAGAVGLSQLLSTQINNLLNTNLANLDVDLNLLGFDQADLGIALRMFDDRLEIRRDGQVTGEYADIGDLGARYHLNRNFAVEVFHRKDPTLLSVLGVQTAQVENVNGVGLEAQFQFNTWSELASNVWSSIQGLFGRRDQDEEDDDDGVVASGNEGDQ